MCLSYCWQNLEVIVLFPLALNSFDPSVPKFCVACEFPKSFDCPVFHAFLEPEDVIERWN